MRSEPDDLVTQLFRCVCLCSRDNLPNRRRELGLEPQLDPNSDLHAGPMLERRMSAPNVHLAEEEMQETEAVEVPEEGDGGQEAVVGAVDVVRFGVSSSPLSSSQSYCHPLLPPGDVSSDSGVYENHTQHIRPQGVPCLLFSIPHIPSPSLRDTLTNVDVHL
mgnify:FL=1